MERQAINQEKVFVYHVSEIGLLSRIYKELLKLCSKVTNNPTRKMSKKNQTKTNKPWIGISMKRLTENK